MQLWASDAPFSPHRPLHLTAVAIVAGQSPKIDSCIVEDSTDLSHRTWRSQAHWEAASLLAHFHCIVLAGRYCACCQRRRTIIPQRLVDLWEFQANLTHKSWFQEPELHKETLSQKSKRKKKIQDMPIGIIVPVNVRVTNHF